MKEIMQPDPIGVVLHPARFGDGDVVRNAALEKHLTFCGNQHAFGRVGSMSQPSKYPFSIFRLVY